MQDLIKRIEAADGPCRELRAEIGRAFGIKPKLKNVYKRGYYPQILVRVDEIYPAFESSIDAAMTLAEKRHGDIIREALSRLSSKFNLHICFWPDSENYSEWLARFVCAAALRARQ